jgi:hypothetical protein
MAIQYFSFFFRLYIYIYIFIYLLAHTGVASMVFVVSTKTKLINYCSCLGPITTSNSIMSLTYKLVWYLLSCVEIRAPGENLICLLIIMWVLLLSPLKHYTASENFQIKSLWILVHNSHTTAFAQCYNKITALQIFMYCHANTCH